MRCAFTVKTTTRSIGGARRSSSGRSRWRKGCGTRKPFEERFRKYRLARMPISPCARVSSRRSVARLPTA